MSLIGAETLEKEEEKFVVVNGKTLITLYLEFTSLKHRNKEVSYLKPVTQ